MLQRRADGQGEVSLGQGGQQPLRGDVVAGLLADDAREISYTHHRFLLFEQVLGALKFERSHGLLSAQALGGFPDGVLRGASLLAIDANGCNG